jgi:hypothetical protein
MWVRKVYILNAELSHIYMWHEVELCYFQVESSSDRCMKHAELLQKNFNTFSYPWGNCKGICCNLVGYETYQCYLFDKILNSLEAWKPLKFLVQSVNKRWK